MFCKNCGAEITDGSAKFCEHCGTQLTGAAVEQTAAGQGSPEQPTQQFNAASAADMLGAQQPPTGSPEPPMTGQAQPNWQQPGQPGQPMQQAGKAGGGGGKGPVIAIIAAAVIVVLIIFGGFGCLGGKSGGSSSSAASTTASSSTASSSAASSTSSSSSASSSTSASSSSSASKSSSSGSSGGGIASTQTIGDPKTTGTVQVPADWKDRSSDYDQRIIDDTDLVYYVDPTTEYTSSALAHFSFSQSIEMRVAPTSYEQVAYDTMSGWKAKGFYTNIDSEDTTFNGHKATVMTCALPEDGIYLFAIAIDRDNDDHAAVLIKGQGTPNTVESVLGYASTWTY